MKSMKPKYAIVYSYVDESYDSSWTEWEVIPFLTFTEMEKYLVEHPSIRNRSNFTIMRDVQD